jgi:PKD repeat protein
VSGLPFGLQLETNEPQGIYYPQNDPYGCARICGTPIGAGIYTISINIIAQVNYNGFTLNVPQQFPITLVVQAGSGSNTGFTFTPTNGCGTADVLFNALIDGQGAPVTYDWDFGNGNTSNDASPSQTFTVPGTYAIQLQTTIGGNVITSVVLSGVNDNWCGDVEEVSLFGSCQGDPDLYFVLTDAGGGTITSATQDNTTNATWNGLTLLLDNPPYSISFFDEDPVSTDDALGTFNIPLSGAGNYPFNVAGGTFGNLQVDLVAQQVFNDTDTVVVFAAPLPVITYDTLAGTICVLDTGLVNITWFNDGDTVLTGTLACIPADSSGTWWAVVNNGFGCAAVTDTVVICPVITIQQSGEVLFTESGLDNYLWSLNGELIPGANNAFLLTTASGLYAVTATNAQGCSLLAEYLLLITGDGAAPPANTLGLFPNPTDGVVTLLTPSGGQISVLDLTGRIVLTRTAAVGISPLDLQPLGPGTYVIRCATKAGVVIGRVDLLR